jgi:hypothetical protein
VLKILLLMGSTFRTDEDAIVSPCDERESTHTSILGVGHGSDGVGGGRYVKETVVVPCFMLVGVVPGNAIV